jgi:amidase
VPPRTPSLQGDIFARSGAARKGTPFGYRLGATTVDLPDGRIEIRVEGETEAPRVQVFVNGVPLQVARDGITFTARCTLPAKAKRPRHSEWREPYGHLVLLIAEGGACLPVAEYLIVDGAG